MGLAQTKDCMHTLTYLLIMKSITSMGFLLTKSKIVSSMYLSLVRFEVRAICNLSVCMYQATRGVICMQCTVYHMIDTLQQRNTGMGENIT